MTLSEDEMRLVKRLAKEVVYEVLETEVYGGFFSFLDAVEAGIANFKRQAASKKGVSVEPAAVKEETFTCLRFEPQKGAKIGDYEVAYKEHNAEAEWLHAFNILKQNNAHISNRYHGEGYAYAYWLYGEGRIYRQKLSQKQ